MRIRRHAVCLAAPALALVGLAAAAGVVLARVPSVPGRLVLGAVLGVLAVRYVLVPYARWRTTVYLVGGGRVAALEGLLHRSRRDVPLARVVDLDVQQRAWQVPFGAGTLTLRTAGGGEPLELRDVPEVHRLHDALLAAGARG